MADLADSMQIHALQCVFLVEKLSYTHKFFHKYEEACTEKLVHVQLLILMWDWRSKIESVV